MSFNVRFYTMGKEVNSTAVPEGEGTLIPCVANGRLDMLRPSIKLQRGLGGGSDSPRLWNYCYIQPFNRFYFVQNWSYDGGLWYADCAVDVLGTYRSEIGELSAYVLRSASAYDGAIADGMYPAKNQFTHMSVSSGNPWIQGDIFFGTIVCGVAGSGSTYYYKFTYVNFINFISALMSDEYANTVVSKLGLQVYSEAKAIIDPLQYITSVIFIPVQSWEGMEERVLTVGYGAVNVNCSLVTSLDNITVKTLEIGDIPKHPQAAERGEYMNHSPFTRYVFDVPPFGAVEIDPDKIGSSLRVRFTIDWCTGNTVMRIYGGTGAEISLLKGNVGVTIQVGQVIKQGFGLLSAVQTGIGVVGGFLSNPFQGIAGAAGAIKDVINSQIPSVNTVGSVGSYADLAGVPTLYAQFTHVVEDSVTTRGRPLCQTRRISTLPGYMVVADPDITGMHATGQEKEMIEQFLTGGFYYA